MKCGLQKITVVLVCSLALGLVAREGFARKAAGSQNPTKDALALRGGPNPDASVPMEFNRDYKLSHHMKKGEFDYFSVNIPPDSVITIEAKTFDKGISWNNNRRVTTTEPFAGLQLLDEKKAIVETVDIAGTPNDDQKASFRNRNATNATYWVRVGSEKGSIHKDQMIFKVTESPFVYGDLGTPDDAGPTAQTAFPILPMKAYKTNSLGGGDVRDVYVFSAKKKEYYTVAIKGEDPIQSAFRVTVRGPGETEKKAKPIAAYISGGTQQIVTRSFKIPEDGPYYVEVSLMRPEKEKSLYSLELLKAAGPGDKGVSSDSENR